MEDQGIDLSAIIDSIVRPPKNTYAELPENSTPRQRVVGGKHYNLNTFKVTNPEGSELSCTYMSPVAGTIDKLKGNMVRPCIIYLHGNAGNQMEGLSYADEILPLGADLCTFDFSGCGNSDGQWVTLGYKEKDDLKAVVAYIQKRWGVKSIGLWGRSMGAATALMYMAENPGIVQCVALDSGFASLRQVMSIFDAMAGQLGFAPNFKEMFGAMVDKQLYDKVGFHVADLAPEEAAKKCKAPAYFLHAKGDEFVKPDNSRRNFAAYGGALKILKMCDGDHNSERPEQQIQELLVFLTAQLLPEVTQAPGTESALEKQLQDLKVDHDEAFKVKEL